MSLRCATIINELAFNSKYSQRLFIINDLAKKTSGQKSGWSNWRILGAILIGVAIIGIVYWLYPRDSPTAAYKRLYAAVKAKNTDAIKKELTEKSIDFGVMFSERSGKTIEQAYENGFTATTFASSLPEIRDERIKGNMGAVEVWNSKDKTWEDLPFIYENGAWKLAVGDIFAGTYEKPSQGRAQREQEAANAAGNSTMREVPAPDMNSIPAVPSNLNSNTNTVKKKK